MLRRATSGFTLIEALVVLAILGLALSLVLSRGPLRSGEAEIGAAAREVAQTLRHARAMAIAANRPVLVSVEPERNALRIEGRMTLQLGTQIALSMGTTALPRAVLFETDGSATAASIELRIGGRRRFVDVDWLTGRVTVRDALP